MKPKWQKALIKTSPYHPETIGRVIWVTGLPFPFSGYVPGKVGRTELFQAVKTHLLANGGGTVQIPITNIELLADFREEVTLAPFDKWLSSRL